MTTKTTSVSLGRARLPLTLAAQLNALQPGLRGRTVALILLAHTTGLDLQKLVASAPELRRLGVLINQSLRLSRGRGVDLPAVEEAAKKVSALWP
jgi:hypothetical protein